MNVATLSMQQGGSLTLSTAEESTVGTFNLGYGSLLGAGTLNVSSSFLVENTGSGTASLAGTGKVIVKPGATGEILYSLMLNERTFVNEGTLTFSASKKTITGSNGAVIENKGTFNANTEPTVNPAFARGSGTAPLIVNTGTFRKTAGSGNTVVDIKIENKAGTAEATSGKLNLAEGGSSSGENNWASTESGELVFSSGTFTLASKSAWSGNFSVTGGTVTTSSDFNNPSGKLTVASSGSLTVSGGPLKAATLSMQQGGSLTLSTAEESTVGTFNLGYGSLLGAGTLNVSSSFLVENTGSGTASLAGTGKVIVKPGATGEILYSLMLNERTFVNEGTLTFSASKKTITGSNGAVIENKGTFNANTEPTVNPAFARGSGTAPLIVNTGTFRKTAGSGNTVVDIEVENKAGTVEGASGKLVLSEGGSSSGKGNLAATKGSELLFNSGTFSIGSETIWSGDFAFTGGTSTISSGFNNPAGSLRVASGSLTVTGGPVNVATLSMQQGGSLTLSTAEESTVDTFNLGYGSLLGAGTLNVSSSFLVENTGSGTASLAGTGKVIVKPGATGEILYSLTLNERTFVNEGTLTFSANLKTLTASNGARIENEGTFNANTEPTVNPAFARGSGTAPLIVNTGTFRKTAGSGNTVVDIEVENKAGTMEATSGKFSLAEGGSFGGAGSLAGTKGGEVVFGSGIFAIESETTWSGDFLVNGGTVVTGGGINDPSGKLTVSSGSLTVIGGPLKAATLSMQQGGSLTLSTAEESTVDTFNLGYGSLLGAGTLNVSSSFLVENTGSGTASLAGTGKVIVKPGATGEILYNLTLDESTFVNEGTLTFSASKKAITGKKRRSDRKQGHLQCQLGADHYRCLCPRQRHRPVDRQHRHLR